jgi:CheY-like chemotaxis protein
MARDEVVSPPKPASARCVLVAEDDRDLRDILRLFFEGRGCAVVALENGAEALARVQRERFTVAVVDIRSPISVGVALLRILRHQRPDLPIIAITSFGDALLADRVEQLGATHVLEKPFELDELARALESCGGWA